jgi:inhibitor of KinA sporulation pathway (predicted exonuclease)
MRDLIECDECEHCTPYVRHSRHAKLTKLCRQLAHLLFGDVGVMQRVCRPIEYFWQGGDDLSPSHHTGNHGPKAAGRLAAGLDVELAQALESGLLDG